MSDFLLDLGKNPTARKMIKNLGIPIPVPQSLRRAKTEWKERPLSQKNIVFGGGANSSLANVVADSITKAGASPYIEQSHTKVFAKSAEAYARPATILENFEETPKEFRADGIVFDATGMQTPSELTQLYDFFRVWVKNLSRCGRILVLARPPQECANAEHAGVQHALDGFVRSLAKEIGKKGSTAQLLSVEQGAEERLDGVLRFFLSPRSAFISGQPIPICKKVTTDETPFWVKPLDGKVALITGAARGIGAATAKLFAAQGARVVCLDRPEDDAPLSQVVRNIGASMVLLDVTDENAPEILCDEFQSKYGGIDIVVHNAGVTRDKTLARMKPPQWEQAIDINFAAVARITNALIEKNVLRDNGRIICLSSVAGIAGNIGQTNYAASKSAIIGYIQHLSNTLAPRGITVNAIAPGFIETRLTAAIPVMIREAGRRLSALGQGGLPEDVGEAITFLATPGALGITGAVLRVCGGALIGA